MREQIIEKQVFVFQVESRNYAAFSSQERKKYNLTDRITHIFRLIAFAGGGYCVNDLEAIENPININFAFYSYIGYNKNIGFVPKAEIRKLRLRAKQ